MDDFFRFPSTPHLVWLGKDMPRGDKLLSPSEVKSLLFEEVVVEEKIDGANLGISRDQDGGLRFQNRGQYLVKPFSGQFSRLTSWQALHEEELLGLLDTKHILFGEWCAAKHSVFYTDLPDVFLLFDVYDRGSRSFWSSTRRNSFALDAGLLVVPEVFRGMTSLDCLKHTLANSNSRYRDGPMEGVVIRRETSQRCEARAKLVRSDFVQGIGAHWRNRSIEWNRTR